MCKGLIDISVNREIQPHQDIKKCTAGESISKIHPNLAAFFHNIFRDDLNLKKAHENNKSHLGLDLTRTLYFMAICTRLQSELKHLRVMGALLPC